MMSSRPLLPLLLVAALAACGREQPATPPARIEGLQTFQVKAADAAGGRAWEGVVEAVRQATLSAQTNGRVVAVARDVNDRVAAGEVLVRLSAVEQQSGVDAARAQLRAAEASATEADANYRRYANLAKDQFVSRAQLDQARMARDSAAAARDAARAQLANAGQQTDYTTVRAPYAGIVATRDVEPGESVGIGQTLMTVFAPGALRIEVAVPQSEADAIRANPAAVIERDHGRGRVHPCGAGPRAAAGARCAAATRADRESGVPGREGCGVPARSGQRAGAPRRGDGRVRAQRRAAVLAPGQAG